MRLATRVGNVLLLFTATMSAAASAYATVRHDEILELSKQFQPEAYEYAVKNSAEIVPVRDGRSYVLWWQPDGFDPKRDTVFISLHGHAGWATRDFQVWHPHVKKRGYAFLAPQWWYGRSAESVGYAKPKDIYPWLRDELERRGIPPGHVIFEGFSMGGANSYAVSYLDRLENPPYFAITISSAGAMEADFPPNRALLENPAPLAGAHWILYCSEHDEQKPDSCPKMEWTNEQLKKSGVHVDLFIRDPRGGHGGFMKAEVHDPALDLADRVVSERASG